MTDKQIMIDGVDVGECEFYNTDDKTCREVNGKYDTDICEFDKCENSNCYFKQLARKTQECERLKNERIVDLVKQLDRLKASKEQAEQKLERIKEFVTALCYTVMSDGVTILQKDILQIIDEVE